MRGMSLVGCTALSINSNYTTDFNICQDLENSRISSNDTGK